MAETMMIAKITEEKVAARIAMSAAAAALKRA
jgi:hypothetical protein